MKRLTDKDSGYLVNDEIYASGKNSQCKEMTGIYSKDVLEEAITRLAEYEDTGLTPEEIKQMNTHCTYTNTGCGDCNYTKILAKNELIEALKEKLEQQKGCKYCKTGCELGEGEEVFITDNTLVAYRYSEADSYIGISFCPMCGRKLGE